MEWIAGLAIIVATAAIAYTIGKNQAPSKRKIDELENLVVEKDSELQQYRQKVNHHFEKTANLFGKVTEDYQALYQFMAQSSEHLVGAQPFKNAMEHKPSTEQIDTDFKGEDTFSTEQFYRAHEYRNQDEAEANAEVTEKQQDDAVREATKDAKEHSADIIHLDKSNDSEDRPLDYAIKEKGVINHNSLNMDNVKT